MYINIHPTPSLAGAAPRRAISNREAVIDIISMAHHARPNDIGQSDDLRAQFTAWSSLAKIRPSKPPEPVVAMEFLAITNHYRMRGLDFSSFAADTAP